MTAPNESVEAAYVRIFETISKSIIGSNGDATSKLELRVKAAEIARDLTTFMFSREKE